LEDLSVNRRIILELNFEKLGERVWIGCVLLSGLVNTVMNFRVP